MRYPRSAPPRSPLSPPSRRLLGAAAGLALDRLVGEPPPAVHPVAGFGTLMGRLEGRWYRDCRSRGLAHLLAGAGIGAVAAWRVPVGVAVAVASASRMLGRSARAVGRALDGGDLDAARALLPGLVGRDPRHLDVAGVSRAVVESVAENTVDAVVAPVVWALAAGSRGVLVHRAVNTLDAMVGHRSARYARFGWASARADDAMAWVPARVTAVAVAAARPGRAKQVWEAVRHQAPAHPSPNAGVAEAAFAAALGVRLGGTNRYGDRVEHRAVLGSGPAPQPADIGRAVRLLDDITWGLAATCVAGGAAIEARRWVRARLDT